MPTLNLTNSILSYGDVPPTSNPLQRFIDQASRRIVSVSNPKTDTYTIDPGATFELFNSNRSTLIDNTTQFTLTLSPLFSTTYRFTNSAGTAPGLRTNRAINLSGHLVTMTANTNLTLSMAATAGDFTSVQVGDTLFIPGVTTGDSAGPFSPLNEGIWLVLSKDGTSSTLQLARPANQTFVSASEAVTPSSAGQVLAYSATGVQQGDKVLINAGFPTQVLNTYVVTGVTPNWFEVVSTTPLPIGVSGTPTTSGISFFSNAKRWIRLEADQNCVIQLNGDTGNSNTLSPWGPADKNNTGAFEKAGPCYTASVKNISSVQLNLLFLSAE